MLTAKQLLNEIRIADEAGLGWEVYRAAIWGLYGAPGSMTRPAMIETLKTLNATSVLTFG